MLVNNAGMAVRKDSHELTASEIDEVLAVNVRSALLTTVAVLPAMLAAGSGSIISISSISGLRGAPRRAVYAASKAALDGMTRALAMEYGPHGIRANAVAPGVVETDMWHANLAKPGVADAVLGVIPPAGCRRRRRSPTRSCSWPRTRPGRSPARPSRPTAASTPP